MPITKRRLPEILIAMIFFIVAVWNFFTANVMEQFLRFHSFASILGGISRWIGMCGFVILPVALIYREERCRILAITAVLPAILIGLCLPHPYFAVHENTHIEIAAYISYNIASFIACLYILCSILYERLAFRPTPLQTHQVSVKSVFVLFVLLAAGCAPLNFFMQFRSLMKIEWLRFRIFGAWHILFVLLCAAATFALASYLKNKSKKQRFFAMLFLSGVLLYQLAVRFSFVRLHDYQTAHGIIGALPLYVCSFGIMLLPFAVLSHSSFFRSALFLINTPGAIIAFVNPTIGHSCVLHYNTTYFVFSHVLLFAVTANLVLRLGARPNASHLKALACLIPCYYTMMFALNVAAVLSNPSYDPNFSFVSTSPLPIRFEKILPVSLGPISFSPFYLLLLCAIQFALAFITYAVYRLIADKFKRRKNFDSKEP